MMPILRASRPPEFADLESSGHCLENDWSGNPLTAPVRFLFRMTKDHFYFLASSELGVGTSTPGSEGGIYEAELWKHDVAEFFLGDPATGNYLEFNLAPNGAWWSCGFSGVRLAARGQPVEILDVETRSERGENSWRAMARLPLPLLRERYRFGSGSTLNATFILKSPDQIFLTAGAASDGPPDFHRPQDFPPVEFIALA